MMKRFPFLAALVLALPPPSSAESSQGRSVGHEEGRVNTGTPTTQTAGTAHKKKLERPGQRLGQREGADPGPAPSTGQDALRPGTAVEIPKPSFPPINVNRILGEILDQDGSRPNGGGPPGTGGSSQSGGGSSPSQAGSPRSQQELQKEIRQALQALASQPQTPETIAAQGALEDALLDLQSGRLPGSSGTAAPDSRLSGRSSTATRARGGAPGGRATTFSSRPALSATDRGLREKPLYSFQATLRGGRSKLSLLDATQALDRNPDDLNARVDRAEALNELGQYEEAAADALKALEREPRLVQALNALAYAYNKRGQYSLALQAAEKALAEQPYNAMAHLNKAMALEGLKRLEEALFEYEKAANLDPALKTFLEDAVAKHGAVVGYKSPGRESAPEAPSSGPPAKEILLLLLGTGIPLALWAAIRQRLKPTFAETLKPASAPGKTLTSSGDGVIGQVYRIDRKIGEGGMGLVFEGTDTALQRKVAIKKMRPELRESPREVEMFLEEARLVASLRHANLVEIFAVLQEKGEVYLVFEYVAGRPLDKLLEAKRRLSLAEALHLLGQVGAGLDYAHSKKVIHRDLKPANVMVSNEGVAKVMDFGIAHRAKLSVSKTTFAGAWGTRVYMAPEQEMGAVSRESDVYALGVMAYELLTGAIPFPGPNFLEQKKSMHYTPATQLVRQLPPHVDSTLAGAPAAQLLRELPPHVDSTLACALAADPGRRFHSAAAFVHALASVAP